jgi:hypothetical protein
MLTIAAHAKHDVISCSRGFYSVFSLTEEPLVQSGDHAMLFRWEGPQLTWAQTQRGKARRDGLTRLSLPLKPAKQLSVRGGAWDAYVTELKEFLLRLVVFLKNVRTLRIELDGQTICTVRKVSGLVNYAKRSGGVGL